MNLDVDKKLKALADEILDTQKELDTKALNLLVTICDRIPIGHSIEFKKHVPLGFGYASADLLRPSPTGSYSVYYSIGMDDGGTSRGWCKINSLNGSGVKNLLKGIFDSESATLVKDAFILVMR